MGIVGSRNFLGVAGSVLLLAAVGCGAGDTGRTGGSRPGLASGGTGLPTTGGAGRATGPTGNTGGKDAFGNPTGPAPAQPMGPMRPVTECLEPTIQFVVDGSGSMCEPFGASTRWEELRKALLDRTEGLIHQLSARAEFGMLIYDGTVDIGLASGAPMGAMSSACAGRAAIMRGEGMCPQYREVAPAFNNADNIDGMFPRMSLGGSTPTDKALNYAIDKLLAAQVGVDLTKHPQYIVLATDGLANDICVGGVGGDGLAQQQAVIAAVTRAAQSAITTFVISLAGGDAALEAHLAMVAAAGNPNDPAAHTLTPATPADLNAALTLVLGTALGCSVD